MSKLASLFKLDNKIVELQNKIIKKDFNNMSYGPSAYDTAWVARIQNGNGKPVFPQSLRWVRQNMNEDYTWGESNHFIYFDRLLSTLSATNALLTYGYTKNINQIMFKIDIMSQLLKKEKKDPGIAFGLLYPSLVISLENKTGFDLLPDGFRRKFFAKLYNMKLDALFSQKNYLAWSAEFLEPIHDYKKIDLSKQVVEEGSLLGSNSATAYYSMKTGRSVQYLRSQMNYDGSVPLFSVQRDYNLLWQLLFFSDNCNIYNLFRSYFTRMDTRANKIGITMGEPLPFPDADCTAILFYYLLKLGIIDENDPRLKFSEYYSHEETGFYDSFPVNRKVSDISNRSFGKKRDRFAPSVNFHLYILYRDINTRHGRYVIDRLDDAFDSYYRSNPDLPGEKWHTDPSYSHTRAIQAFSGYRDDLAERSFNYFLENKNEGGYWGPFDHFCPEINAYALIGISHFNKFSEKIDTSICNVPLMLLSNNITPTCKLYTGKTTYRPDFVDGAILAAFMYGWEL